MIEVIDDETLTYLNRPSLSKLYQGYVASYFILPHISTNSARFGIPWSYLSSTIVSK